MILFKFIFSIAFIGISVSHLASAATITERKLLKGIESPLAGYAIAEPVFEGDIFGKHFKLNGTALEVYNQLEKIIDASKLAAGLKPSHDDGHDAAGKRSKVFNPLCIPVNGQNWVIGDSYQMSVCSNALRAMGQSSFIVPPRTCGRMCANGGIEAWICNTRFDTIYPNCGYLGSYVDDIRGICKLQLGFKVTLAGGQLFDTDGYSVIAKRA